METDSGRLYFATGIDNSKLRSDAAESRNILASIGQSANAEGAQIDAAFTKIAKAAGGIFALGQAKEFIRQIVSVRGEIESLEISFETLAGKAQGEALFSQIRKFAVQTPMMVGDLAKGAQTMLAFNIEAQNVMPILRAIGDISMGDAQKFNSLSLAFSQMSATGKLMGQDLLQMINAGFNPLSVISEKTGKSIGELKEEMEQGGISTEMVTEAFMSATSAGGKFYGMLEKQSHGINGAISNLQGAIEDMYNELGQLIQDSATGTIEFATKVVQNYDAIGAVLGGLIAMYGYHRAELMAVQAVEQARLATSAQTVAAVEAELAAVGQKTAVQQLSTDADLAAAVAKGDLTVAQGLEILSAKQEAQARVVAIEVAAKQAEVDAAAATSARIQAGERLRAAETNAAAMRMEYQAALAKGEVFQIAVAKTAVDTATNQVNTASEQYQAAATAESAAAKKAKTAALDANTAKTQLNTASINANSAAEATNASKITLATLLKSKLSAATSGLLKILGSSAAIYTAVGVAVGALGYGYYKQGEEARELARKQKELNKTMAETEAAAEGEKAQISLLFYRLRNAKEGTEEYKSIKEEILKNYGSYLKGMSDEVQSLHDVEGAYKAVAKAAIEAAKARSVASIAEAETDDLTKKRGEAYDQIKARLEKLYRNRTNKDGVRYVDLYLEHFSNVLDGKEYFNSRDTKLFNRKDAAGKSYNPIYDIISRYRRKEAESQARIEQARARYGLSQISDKEEKDSPELWKDRIAAQRKALKDANAELKRLQADSKTTVKDMQAAMAKVEKAKKALKDSGIDVDKESKAGESAAERASKAAETQRNLLDTTRKNARERKRIEEDAELELTQNRIDLMAEGADKTRLQMQLDFRKEQLALNREKEDAIEAEIQRQQKEHDAKEDAKAAANKSYHKREFSDDDVDQSAIDAIEGLYVELADDLREKREKTMADQMRSELEAMNQYLQQYGTYQQQKLAIAESYAKKIREAETEGEKLLLAKERDDKLASLKANSLAMNIDWGESFKGIGKVLGEIAKETLKQVEEYMRTDEFKRLTPENKQKYVDLRNRLRTETGGNATSVFNLGQWSKISQLAKNYQQAVEKVDAATKAHERAIQAVSYAEEHLANATTEADKQIYSTALKFAKQNVVDTASAVSDAQQEKDESNRKLHDATDAAVQGMENFANSISEMSNGSLYGFANGVAKLFNSLKGGSDGAAKALEGLGGKVGGLIGAILQIIDALGDDPSQFFKDLLAKVATVVESFMSNLPQILESVGSGILDIVTGFFRGVGNFWGSVFGIDTSNAEQVRANIEKLNEHNERLTEAIEELNDTIKASLGAKSIQAYDEAVKKQRQKNRNLLEAAHEQARYYNGHHSWEHDWGGFADWQISWLSKEIGRNWNGDIWNLSPKEMKVLRSNLQMWNTMRDSGHDGYGQSVVDALSAYADQAGKIDELTTNLYESMTSISFDSLYDSFVDTLMDMDASAQDFSNNLTKYLTKALLSNAIGDQLNANLKDWYNRWGKAMKDGKGTMSQSLQESLRQEWDAIVAEGLAIRDSIAASTGYDDTSEREGAKKGIASASQDSIDELNARMTTVQAHTYSISENTRLMLSTTQGLLNSVLHIESETDGLRERMTRVEGYTKGIHDTLGDIATKGVRLQ